MRTNSGNMRDTSPLSKSIVNSESDNNDKSDNNKSSFKRGGYLRSTAGARLQFDSNSKNGISSSFIK